MLTNSLPICSPALKPISPMNSWWWAIATLTQGTLVQPDAASYNMNLSWAALEGADQYAVSYFKDNTSYQYTVFDRDVEPD